MDSSDIQFITINITINGHVFKAVYSGTTRKVHITEAELQIQSLLFKNFTSSASEMPDKRSFVAAAKKIEQSAILFQAL